MKYIRALIYCNHVIIVKTVLHDRVNLFETCMMLLRYLLGG